MPPGQMPLPPGPQFPLIAMLPHVLVGIPLNAAFVGQLLGALFTGVTMGSQCRGALAECPAGVGRIFADGADMLDAWSAVVAPFQPTPEPAVAWSTQPQTACLLVSLYAQVGWAPGLPCHACLPTLACPCLLSWVLPSMQPSSLAPRISRTHLPTHAHPLRVRLCRAVDAQLSLAMAPALTSLLSGDGGFCITEHPLLQRELKAAPVCSKAR